MLKKILVGCFILANGIALVNAAPAITEDKVSVQAPSANYTVGANKIEIGYSYLLLGSRTVKINYTIDGTNCSEEKVLPGEGGISIKDKITFDCELNQKGIFNSHAQICSFDGNVQKSCAKDDKQITVS